MKSFLNISLIVLFLSGCSYDNAFSRFDISEKKAKSEESIVSSKIYDKKEVLGIVSSVYLNAVNPEQFHDGEYFYVYLYVKNKEESLTFSLNDVNASSVKELYRENEFAQLTSSNAPWQQYYLVKFPKQDDTLVFKVSLTSFTSDPIVFEKNQ